MIKTNGDFVSEVRNHLKANNMDDYIPARYILSTANSFLQYLINTRPLSSVMRDLDVFTVLDCFEMRRVKSYTCDILEFRTCDKIMKSTKKIPKLFNGKSGWLIESVLNVTDSQEYDPLRSPKDFLVSKQRQFGNKFKYFYIQNDYLYLLNSTSELVRVNGYFVDEDEVNKACGCGEIDECASKLDAKFPAPDEFVSQIMGQTVQLLLGGRRQITPDENPNLDENNKGATRGA